MRVVRLPVAAYPALALSCRPLNGLIGLWINSDRIHRAGPNMAAVTGQDGADPFIPGSASLRYDFVMNNMRPFVFLTCAALLAASAVPAWAQQERGNDRREPQPRIERPRPPEMGERSNPRTMSESVRWAQRTTGGQVLGAERVQSDGHDFNRVKLIDDRGRVRYVDDVRQQRERDASPPAPSRQSRSPGF